MAYVVAWFAFDGQPIDDERWNELVRRTRERAPLSSTAWGQECRHTSFRAYAIRVLESEPSPLRQLTDGRFLLTDSRGVLSGDEVGTALDEASAQVILDPALMQVVMARDRLGQRPLVWARIPGAVIVASRESILLGHPGVSRELDEAYLCAHLGGLNAESGRTLYRSIATVDPASVVTVDAIRSQVATLAFDPELEAYAMQDRPAAVRFRELLEDSVARCCAGASTLGISLSAGLDSSSVAALLPKSRRSLQTIALNYGTTFRGSVDERDLARALSTHLGLRFECMDTADYPPALDAVGMQIDPAHPYVNPYLPLNAAVYRSFRDLGVDVFLTGHFADFWNPGPGTWLRDALRNSRWDVVQGAVSGLWQKGGVKAIWRDPGWRYLVKRALRRNNRKEGYKGFHPRWREWAQARDADDSRRYAHWPHPQRAAYNFGSDAALDCAYEGHYRDQFGVHSRHPYRDWPLLRFMLSLPGYQSYRSTTGKWIARQAVAELLPAQWSHRPKQGGLLPFLEAAIERHDPAYFKALINAGREMWEPLLDEEYVDRELLGRANSTSGDWLFWQLVMMGVWSGSR